MDNSRDEAGCNLLAASAKCYCGAAAYDGSNLLQFCPTDDEECPQLIARRMHKPSVPLPALGPKSLTAAPGAYPDNNPKTVYGEAKPPLHAIPASALLLLGQVMASGEAKYGLVNWRQKKVSATVYFDAAMRHLLAWLDGQTNDPESGLPHLAHVMACCAIVLDAGTIQGALNDNRPYPGMAPDMIAKATRPAEGVVGG